MVNLKNQYSQPSSQPTNLTGFQPLPKEVKSRKPGNPFFKVVILIIALVFIAGGVVLATGIYDPYWNPFRPNPAKVLANAMLKSQQAKSMHSKIDASFKVSASGQNGDISIILDGDSDLSNTADPKINMNFDLAANPGANVLSGALRIVNKKAYFNLKEFNLPAISFFATQNGLDFSKAKNIWIEASEAETLSGVAPSSTPESLALQEKVRKIFAENPDIYNIKKQLADETIDGQKNYHYLISINNQKLSEVVGKIISASMDANNANSPIAVGAVKGALIEMLNNIGEINIDVFIGKKDNYIYRTKLDKRINLSAISPMIDGILDVKLEVNNTKFGQPVNIVAPAPSKKMEDVFPEMKNSKIKSGMINIQSDISEVWVADKSYKNATCQNNLLKFDCEDVLKNSGVPVKINKSNTKFCAYVPLIGSTPSYYCIDGGGQRIITLTNPGKYGYCSGASYKCPPAAIK